MTRQCQNDIWMSTPNGKFILCILDTEVIKSAKMA